MRVVSARIHYWDEPNSELTLEDTTVLNNKNYFPITMTALNTSVAISWSSSGVYNEVSRVYNEVSRVYNGVSRVCVEISRVYDEKSTTKYEASVF